MATGLDLSPQCGQCEHWKVRTDNMQYGECRQQPPQIMAFLKPGPAIEQIPFYRTLPREFVACDQFQRRPLPVVGG